MAEGYGHESLLRSPTNLKEAIDWILRLTGKDGTPNTKCLCLLSEVIHDLVRDVEGYLDKEELGVVRGTLVDLQGVEGTRRISELLEGVATGLQKFVGYNTSGKLEEKDGIAKSGYTSSYKSSGGSPPSGSDCKWDEIYQKCIESGTSGTLATLARILLGCIPFIFSGLSYMAWMAGSNKWSGNSTTQENYLLCQFMMRMGYDREKLRKVNGDKLYTEVIETSGILGEEKPSGNYAQYLDELRKQAGKKQDTELPLLKLNILCSGYFRSLHTIDSIRSTRPRTPNTVREILYWLTSLPYCPIYRTLVPKVQEMIQRIGSKKTDKSEVVFYGATWDGVGKELKVSDENCASYLLGAALIAPMVLLTIQDTIECLVGKVTDDSRRGGHKSYKLKTYENKVSIHDLYANMQFWFSYPMSETQSYYLLQDCLVALYYQMYFLYEQCHWKRQYGYGWGYCKYGDQVKCDEGGKDGVGGTGCLSWICPVGDKKGHNNGSSGPENTCGNPVKASPLQAFLTDCLKGFTCDRVTKLLDKNKREDIAKPGMYQKCYPPFLEHRTHLPVGQECAVPMGFTGSFRLGGPASGSQCVGLGIQAILDAYANDIVSESILYQITRCICSLTRRVPRSTGTLYGFFYGLGAMSSTTPGNGGNVHPVASALSKELECCPGWREPSCLLDAVKDWKGTSHQKDPGKCCSLDSIQNCDSNKQSNQTCGYYLWPLTGILYKCAAPEFCETYVSWIVHLTGVLKTGLIELQKAFRDISCEDCHCSPPGGKKCSTIGCKKGTHGKSKDTGGAGDGCCCDNVVDCVGVHGLFYRFGFRFFSSNLSAGKYDNGRDDNKRKRQCNQFYQQLEKVIGGNLFDNLFKEIRKFIYSTRALFGLYIGVYWSIVLVYLLWSIIGPLDLLHIQSHWRSTSSYLVPLQRILADGSRKGFCSVGYFQENTGDSLLSQGVSDVYL